MTYWRCMDCGEAGVEKLGKSSDSGLAAAHVRRNPGHTTESTVRPEKAVKWGVEPVYHDAVSLRGRKLPVPDQSRYGRATTDPPRYGADGRQL